MIDTFLKQAPVFSQAGCTAFGGCIVYGAFLKVRVLLELSTSREGVTSVRFVYLVFFECVTALPLGYEIRGSLFAALVILFH